MLQLDLREFERKARDIGGAIDQVPFALAGALNDALFKARDHLINQTWPHAITVRNPNFIRAALNVDKATKGKLAGAVFDRLGRASLNLHAKGGTKAARGRLAIPSTAVKGQRTAKGVPRRLRPATAPNTFRKGDAIFQRVGWKPNGAAKRTSKSAASTDKRRVQLLFTLRRAAQIRKDVPFVEDFRRVVLEEVRRSFPQRMARAMATRR
ncbi:hypothetical protein [Bosea sp. BK604]|uniref:hypothetical protein n=1 Tax=Bosea sp. BK604 TaxID=2512180 RepID=UPI001047CDEE|nr:hypothetical protein [Bosea sp. BK604]TCR60953.1 hypothetical protein EV560_115178 [Bosea sp. BK604]